MEEDRKQDMNGSGAAVAAVVVQKMTSQPTGQEPPTDVGGGMSAAVGGTRRGGDGEPGGGDRSRSRGVKGGAFTIRLSLAIASAVIGTAFQHGYNTGVVNAPQQLIESWIASVLPAADGGAAIAGDAVTTTNLSDSLTSPDAADTTMADAEHRGAVTAMWAVAVAIFCVGGMIGGALTGLVADRCGRRNGLLLNNLFGVGGALCQGGSYWAESVAMLVAGRLLVGVCAGLGAGLAPLYLAEISPLRYRGAVGTVYQLVVTISILISQALGLPAALGTPLLWPHLLAFSVLPAVLQLVSLPFCPETPSHLIAKGRQSEAARALSWLRGSSVACSAELDALILQPETDYDVQQSLQNQEQLQQRSVSPPPNGGANNDHHKQHNRSNNGGAMSLRSLLASPPLRAALWVTLGVMLAQQFSGINAVMFYSTDVFREAGMSGQNAQYATLGMGLVNVLATVGSLSLVERVGRRVLLVCGLGGMCVNSVLLAAALHWASGGGGDAAGGGAEYDGAVGGSAAAPICAVILVMTYVTLFASGPGSIPWFLASELFDDRARPTATALAVVTNWAANFLVGLGFLPLQMLLGGWVFLVFAALLALAALFVVRTVPETKNKTVEEIQRHFRKKQ